MRVLALFFGGGAGGDARVCLDLAEAWARMGHEVTVAARATRASETMRRRAEKAGLPMTTYRALREFLRNQRRAGARYDAAFLHVAGEVPALGSQVLPLVRSRLAAKHAGVFHGAAPLSSLGLGPWRRLLVRVAVGLLDSAAVPSRHKVGEWRELFGPDVRIRAIANPVQPIEPGEPSEARRRLGLDEDLRWLAFVGLFRAEKGALEAVRAAALLRSEGVGLALAGDGPEREPCERLASSLQAPCRFLGYLEDPSDLYRGADAFVFPSRWESFGLSLMQAAGLGLPIAASDLPIVRDELDFPGAVFRFPPGDAEAMAEALRRALRESDPASLAAMRQATLELTLPERAARRHLMALGAE
ncbi:MAG: glycosyltransferase family 4 protein [Fimbriimonadales bacterium]|nr:glycosyltransferase family 4 protein [Fimbriimonadales bacterium]